MRYLIMSCQTGGGHNSAAHAVEEELLRRGHEVDFLDPYDLIDKKLSLGVGGAYVKLVQRFPKLFGAIYFAGDIVSKIPLKSPVYLVNAGVAYRLRQLLMAKHYDGIITSHLYPAEMLTMLKRHKMTLPKTFFVATDYTCIPFTAETDCDYYCLPGPDAVDNFASKGIDPGRIIAYGIPVGRDFDSDKCTAKPSLAPWLSPDMRHIVLVGGSVGAGKIKLAVKILRAYIRIFNDKVDKGIIRSRKLHAIVICGNNKKLYRQLRSKRDIYTTVLRTTDNMSEYIKSCDIMISKPGGLTSTEAAVSKVPLIHISPIPGCETFNVKYFEARGMSVYVKDIRHDLSPAISALLKSDNRAKMLRSQTKSINDSARSDLCDFIEANST